MPGISQPDFVGQQQHQHQQHQQQQQQQQQHVVNPTLAHNYAAPQPIKLQDQVKVVYSNSANNRNYVPVNSLPNGTINSTSTGTGTAVVIKSTTHQQQQSSPPVSTMTLTGQVSSNQSPVTSNVITVSKQVAQGVVSGNSPQTILPANVQILNVNALRPQNSQGGVNKNMSRVMIPQVVGGRPGAPGLTLQTLQQAQGGHILLKTENGQYQLLRVGPAPGQGTAITQNNANFRVQSVPAVATSNVSIAGTPTTTPTQTIVQPQQAHQKVQQDNTKEKCRKFLANLLELSSKEPKPVERSVRTLIQELVDAKVEPEQFCDRLEKLLNASPQPCLIGFLKKSLPLLRQSLMLKEMVIDGIRPPLLSAVTQPTVVLANQQQTTNTQVMGNIINAASNQQTVRIMTTQQPTLTSARSNNMQHQHRIVSQQVRVQTPTGLTAVNKMGSIRIQPPVASQTGTLPPPLTSTSSPRPMSGSRQMLVKAVPIKTPTGSHIKINTTLASSTVQTSSITMPQPRIPPSPNLISQPTMINKVLTPITSVPSTIVVPPKPPLKEKEKKSFSSSAAYVGDDDINDVAAMGGVNLAEETQRILGSTEFVGTQIRSCKDEILLPQNPLVAKIKQIVNREGLEDAAADVPALVSHALAERLKDLLEKFAVVAEHRLDFNKADKRYEITRNVRGQIKCLEEIDKVERKKQDEMERELLIRAAKSRSKNEDPEQAKLKAKAKEMQRVEMEELRQREANLTALNAIGPRKKPKLEPGLSPSLQNQNSSISTNLTNRQTIPRQRIKRVTMRDTLFVLEQEKDIRRKSNFMFKPFLK